MINPGAFAADNIVSFINRDHIIAVTIHRREIIVTTTAGTTINIAVSDEATVIKFADDLANDIESNFVSIVAQPQVIG
jgi:hypothetical protein